MTDLTIRRANLADARTIAEFNAAMAEETENRTLAHQTITDGVNRFVGDPSLGFYLVAEADGKILGCLGITFEWSDWRNGLFWWIQSVYIEPSHRRHGIFRMLYESVSAAARDEKDVCGLRLYVERDNERAMSTYRNLGMAETDYRLYEVEFTR